METMTGRILTQQEMKHAATAALEAEDFETIETLALRDRKVLSVLVRLAYDKETLIGWRAIIAIGRVASVFVRNNYDFLRETVRKLLWSLSDESGGIGWSAPEMLGEIVSAAPKKFADVIPLLAQVYSIEEEVFKPGVLYALKRIAEADSEAVSRFQMLAVSGLSEKDTSARIHSLELVRILKERLIPENREAVRSVLSLLIKDTQEAWVYKEGGFKSTVVSEIACDVYNSGI